MESEDIAVRAFTMPKDGDFVPDLPTPDPSDSESDRILVVDTETTTDLYQNLKFGYFEVYVGKRFEKCGLFYNKKILKEKEFQILKNFVGQNKIELFSIEDFRTIFLYEVFDLKSRCIGFNLPFDLTRIAIKSTNGRKYYKNGFSLLYSNDLNYPRLHITHISNAFSFIGWGTLKNSKNKFKGNFVDLRTLCFALTNKKYSLESACKVFETEIQKQKAHKHGTVTKEYIKYCINDVKTTYSLYLKTKKEFDGYNLNLLVNKIYTPATIGKQFLKQMNIRSFLKQNPKFPKNIIGNIMTAYFGGRTENKIRKFPTLVDVLDYLSMYPTVCTLLNLWRFVIAEKIECVDATQDISEFIENFKITDIQNKETWSKFHGIVLLESDRDVLPFRSKFGLKNVWNIGVNYLTSKEQPLWYSITDVMASKLYTEKYPKILKAYRFIPKGIQKNLKPINIHGITIDPYKDDLFKKLIEYRQELKEKRDCFQKNDPQHSFYERKQEIIKIITNAISYGIFVEINTHEETKKVPIQVNGLEQFTDYKNKIEQSGYMFNPINAVLITSVSRLLLATTEILLNQEGKTHAYCDTDSMMIPPSMTKKIQKFFKPLNPYDFDTEIFKLEEHRVLFYGISAKRYCLFRKTKNGINIVKHSSHGLGHLLDPFSNDAEEENDDWHKQIWHDILNLHYKKTTLDDLYQKYENKYALSKFVTTSPRILDRLKNFNGKKRYQNQIKPFNFSILGFSNLVNPETFELIKPFAPLRKPAKLAVYDHFTDYHDKSRPKLRGKQYWKPFWDIFLEYLRHPEAKFEGETGILKKKHIVADRILYIGKESNNLDESEILGVDSDGYEIYENLENLDKKFKELIPRILELKPRDVKKFGISKQTLWNVKNNINLEQIHKISTKIKIYFIKLYVINF